MAPPRIWGQFSNKRGNSDFQCGETRYSDVRVAQKKIGPTILGYPIVAACNSLSGESVVYHPSRPERSDTYPPVARKTARLMPLLHPRPIASALKQGISAMISSPAVKRVQPIFPRRRRNIPFADIIILRLIPDSPVGHNGRSSLIADCESCY
jgi:hypothetical protein